MAYVRRHGVRELLRFWAAGVSSVGHAAMPIACDVQDYYERTGQASNLIEVFFQQVDDERFELELGPGDEVELELPLDYPGFATEQAFISAVVYAARSHHLQVRSVG